MGEVTLLLGDADGDHLKIDIGSRLGSAEDTYASWPARVSVRSGTFGGYVDTYLYPWEIAAFVEQLQALYDALTGEAVLDGQEGDLNFRLDGNGRGAITVEGTLRAFGGFRTRSLDFCFDIDQTYLPAFLAGLKTFACA